MRFSILATIMAIATAASAEITYTLEKSSNPTEDEADAYALIEAAIEAAIARHASLGTASKSLYVQYVPGVPTAEASYDGSVRFGTDRSYLNERTALHEISHTLGIGQTTAFDTRCAANDWPTATPLLQSWDGADAIINCGGGHIWPYGLNYNDEWSETNADRHVLLINAMLADGL
ncbi:hypothetical protein BDW69DRAFT_192907 [Aspergillus filifer]